MLRKVLVILFPIAVSATEMCVAGPPEFNRDIRPILSDYCFACHGPDAAHREADLRLDDRAAAVEHGAIVPSAADDSLIIERIFSDDPDLVMPPADSGRRLSDEQRQLIRQWIEDGATYQRHWAFEPVPEAPAVPDAGGNWARNDVDRFVAAKHEEHGFTHAAEADRATWLRRVSFDLTGLPPTVDELETFLADESHDAYEKVVDRLLHSSSYGERMAGMWLDVARYADTFGYQSDVEMEVWPWRDWVIDAFNRNLPYDRFLTEQIAGDLLPDANQNTRLATTFNRLHRQTNEGGSIPEEFRISGIADRTTTAGTAFLGLTFECCRCHDHKFDPILQSDFYRMSAFFSDIDEFGVYSHFTRAQPTPAMLLFQNETEETKYEEAKTARLAAEKVFSDVFSRAEAEVRQQADGLSAELPEVRSPVVHMPLDGEAEGVIGKASRFDGDHDRKADGAVEFGRTSPFSYSIWIRPAEQTARMLVLHQSVAPEDAAFRGIQLTIDDGRPDFMMAHFWPGNCLRVRSVQTIPVEAWTHLAVTHDGSGTARGVRIYVNGALTETEIVRDRLTRDIRHRSEWHDSSVGSVRTALGARFRDVGFRDGLMDELRIYDVQLSSAEVTALYHAADTRSETAELTTEQRIEHVLLTDHTELADARAELQKARDHENDVNASIRQIMVMEHYENAPVTHVLHRGEYTEKRTVVSPGVPEFLGGPDTRVAGRLQLARWMTSPQNPLTVRVIVNRMWHLFFGRGIVVTLEDFGSQGTPPSHPELLDHLARSLMDDGWDLHQLCRRIVLSATYRQSSVPTDPSVSERDPKNTWLARGPRHRLSAEQLRDAALAASGLLVRRIGGASVMPYQPAGLWKEAGTGKTYHQSKGEGLYRRSLYTFWRRTAPPPSMLTFDATSRESCTPRRELTTTPLQALVFLNDPQYVEASRVLAESLVANHPDSPEERWNELFRRLIARPPTDREIEVISAAYGEQIAYFEEDPSRAEALLSTGDRPRNESLDAVVTAATTIVAQTVLAYDETIMLR